MWANELRCSGQMNPHAKRPLFDCQVETKCKKDMNDFSSTDYTDCADEKRIKLWLANAPLEE
jgi:hypothetical protein